MGNRTTGLSFVLHPAGQCQDLRETQEAETNESEHEDTCDLDGVIRSRINRLERYVEIKGRRLKCHKRDCVNLTRLLV